jgi:hypothetical protein
MTWKREGVLIAGRERSPRLTRSILIQILLPSAFVILAVVITSSRTIFDSEKLGNALVSIPFTVAIFAVNFSFLEYQFSAYRPLVRGLSLSHVIAATGVLFLAILPLSAVYLGYSLRTVSGIVTPLVTYASVGLALLARRNADPLHQIESATESNRVWNFCHEYVDAAADQLADLEQLELSRPREMPLHEWDRRTPPVIKGHDPFAVLFQIASLAISTADYRVFEEVLSGLLKISEQAAMYRDRNGEKPDYKIQALLAGHAQSYLGWVAAFIRDSDKTGSFILRFQDVCGQYLRETTTTSRQCGELQIQLMKIMRDLGRYSLSHPNRPAAMVPVVISRELAQRGLTRPDRENDFFFSNLCFYIDVIKDMGIRAVVEKNSEFLYRCLDAVAWFGCSTVKANNQELAISCIQAVVQMGRYARRDQLECFWDRCGLSPWDHAEERLTWMLSWVSQLDTSEHERWLGLFTEAFSRLSGVKTEIDMQGTSFEFKIGKAPHRWTISDNGITRTIDYSDVSFVKEFAIY